MSSVCTPLFRTGVSMIDYILFCIGGVGVTVAVVILTFLLLVLLR